MHFVSEDFIQKEIKPYKLYQNEVEQKPNVVIFIMESFAKEYSGAFNKNTDIKDFISYTPFVDSLANESLIFTNAFYHFNFRFIKLIILQIRNKISIFIFE